MNGWTNGTLGGLCSIEIGGTPSRSNPEYWDSAKDTSNRWVSIRDLNRRIICETAEQITDLGVRNSNVKQQPKGTVLLSFKLSIGRVAFAGCDLYTNEAIAGLHSEELTPEFLFYGLQQWNLLQNVDQAIKGATLNKDKLKKIEFDYPESEVEQTKIARVLSTIDRAIEQTEALIVKQQRIKTGLMQDLLTKGIDEYGNIRSEATHAFKDSPLGRIPVEWEVAPMSAFQLPGRPYIKTGPFGSSLNTKHWVEDGVPVITIGSLGDSGFLKQELLYVSESTAQVLSPYRVISGDIVFSRVADIGRALVITAEQDGWIISSNFMRISLNEADVLPSFLYRAIVFNPITRDQLRIFSNASGREVVNTAILSALLFAWPGPIEQKQINNQLDRVDGTINKSRQALEKLTSLKRGLMHDLLTGKRRVTALLTDKAAHG